LLFILNWILEDKLRLRLRLSLVAGRTCPYAWWVSSIIAFGGSARHPQSSSTPSREGIIHIIKYPPWASPNIINRIAFLCRAGPFTFSSHFPPPLSLLFPLLFPLLLHLPLPLPLPLPLLSTPLPYFPFHLFSLCLPLPSALPIPIPVPILIPNTIPFPFPSLSPSQFPHNGKGIEMREWR
jgi:hypothetical protein